jgi:hypothetical protein
MKMRMNRIPVSLLRPAEASVPSVFRWMAWQSPRGTTCSTLVFFLAAGLARAQLAELPDIPVPSLAIACGVEGIGSNGVFDLMDSADLPNELFAHRGSGEGLPAPSSWRVILAWEGSALAATGVAGVGLADVIPGQASPTTSLRSRQVTR